MPKKEGLHGNEAAPKLNWQVLELPQMVNFALHSVHSQFFFFGRGGGGGGGEKELRL